VSKIVDITGQKFGRLTAKKYLGVLNPPYRATYWLCVCTCNNKTSVRTGDLRSGRTKSCGCLHRETSSKRGKDNATHGMTETPTYTSWRRMLDRCYNKNRDGYASYGGRGVRVDKRWRFGEDNKSGFECFLEDMGLRPKNKTLHRKKDSLIYGPDFCEWATYRKQSTYKRNTIYAKLNGKRRPVSVIARKLKINYHKIWYLVKLGHTEFVYP
jgi:hypothetical protein